MLVLSILLQIGCLTSEITKTPGEFPDNPTDDYDGDGLTEQSGDCDDLNPEVLGPSTCIRGLRWGWIWGSQLNPCLA